MLFIKHIEYESYKLELSGRIVILAAAVVPSREEDMYKIVCILFRNAVKKTIL